MTNLSAKCACVSMLPNRLSRHAGVAQEGAADQGLSGRLPGGHARHPTRVRPGQPWRAAVPRCARPIAANGAVQPVRGVLASTRGREPTGSAVPRPAPYRRHARSGDRCHAGRVDGAPRPLHPRSGHDLPERGREPGQGHRRSTEQACGRHCHTDRPCPHEGLPQDRGEVRAGRAQRPEQRLEADRSSTHTASLATGTRSKKRRRCKATSPELGEQVVFADRDVGASLGQLLAQGVDEQALAGVNVRGDDVFVEGPAVQPGGRAAGKSMDGGG